MVTQYRDEEDPRVPHIPPLTDDEDDDEPTDRNLQIRSEGDETAPSSPSSPSFPIPVWLRESASTFKYKWVPLPIRKASRAVVDWVQGPTPPQVLKIEPIFPKIQTAPLRFMDIYFPKRKQRLALLAALYACWFLTWSLMLRHQATSGFIKGYGKPRNLWCGASFWNEGNGCGLNGNQCRPFSSAHITFRCPANCLETHLLETHYVGNQTVRYKGLVVGGPKAEDPDSLAVYRGDSFICQAAIHAGVTTDALGGCGVASLIGAHGDFQASTQNGVESIAFPGSFPRSFTFQHLSDSQATCPKDSRWPLFAVTASFLVVLSLFTSSPSAFFFSTFILMFFHVGMVSDPPNAANIYELMSKGAERLLPAAIISYVLYRFCAIALLRGLKAQVEKTVLYLGFCFIGALNNYTFAPIIPIARLTPHDLAQPGAGFALAIILTIIIIIVIGQIYIIRLSGNMPKYLAIYATMILTLIILLVLPGLRLRVHHYILALLFLPGTAFQWRPSLAYQGLLLGLFINGIARWGFASIIETPAALGESGGGHSGSWWGATSPNVTATVGAKNQNITFNWGPLPEDLGVDGVSILINDVERWRGYTDDELYWEKEQVTLERRKHEDDGEPEFFRFAWMNGNSAGKYSHVGVWDEQGNWISPPK